MGMPVGIAGEMLVADARGGGLNEEEDEIFSPNQKVIIRRVVGVEDRLKVVFHIVINFAHLFNV
jgi:hypothetical protein